MINCSPADFERVFRSVTDNEPYPYQKCVADRLLSGQNLVLRAPTGAGKTWAVLAPFLYAYQQGKPIADRLLYALPLRSLATSLYRDTCQSVAGAALQSGLFVSKRPDIRLQTGEQKDDPFFEADITFTTIDQLLSSYLFNPLSLPRRVGNINAGALLGSLIVFDEYHLLEPGKSMATSIEMLDRLVSAAPLAQFVLMTATLSQQTADWLAKKLRAEVVELTQEDVAALPSHQNKQRTYRWVSTPLSVENIIEQHRGGRTIVLVNSVSRAQTLFDELRQKFGGTTKLALLHSRFFPEDRRATEGKLAQWFGPKARENDVVLVTTQVIEAGMDLSSDNLHTELAPMNALVQRAGRCARRRNSAGTVWIYELETNVKGMPRLGPYRDQREIIDSTRDGLKSLAGDGRILHYHDELRMVDAVHSQQELAALEANRVHTIRERVHQAMDGENPAAVRELVRDVSSVNVIITSQPEQLRFDRRRWPRFLSVPPTSLWVLQDAFEQPGSSGWVIKEAQECDATGGVLELKWPVVSASQPLNTLGWLVAIHPDYATYDPQLGLIVGRSGPERPVECRDRPQITGYSYHYEPYEVHVRRVIAVADSQADRYQVAKSRLAELYNATVEQLEQWVRLACALHDVGKLAQEWQDAIWRWQEYKDKSARRAKRPHIRLAHSDYDPKPDYGLQNDKAYKKPPHAAEGAYAIQDLLTALAPDDAARAIYSAVTRHHGAWTRSLQTFRLCSDAEDHVRATLAGIGTAASLQLCDGPDDLEREEFAEWLIYFGISTDFHLWPLYAFLSRRLRLTDQGSMKDTAQ